MGKHIDRKIREITFKIIDRIIGINLEYESKTGRPLTISRVSKVLLSGSFSIAHSTKKFHAVLVMFLRCKENLRLENERDRLFLSKQHLFFLFYLEIVVKIFSFIYYMGVQLKYCIEDVFSLFCVHTPRDI